MKQIIEIEFSRPLDIEKIACAITGITLCTEDIPSVREILPKTPAEDEAEMEKAFVKWMRKTFGYKDKMNHLEYMNFNYHKYQIFKAGAGWKRRGEVKP